MNVNMAADVLIYPWSKAETRKKIKEAFELIQKKARAQRIDFRYSTRSGAPLITTGSIPSRGAWNGHRVALHSGIFPEGKRAPFNSIDALARIICHEGGHMMGVGHRPNGVMHVYANNWFSKWEIERWRQEYGIFTPESKAQELKRVNQRMRELRDGIKRANLRHRRDVIGPSRVELESLKEQRDRLRKELGRD